MASYPPPNEKYNNLYNSLYFTSKGQYAVSEGIENTLSDDFMRKDGTTIMTGHLTTPSIVLFNDGTIQFSDSTVQNTAFTEADRINTSTNQQKLTKQSYDTNTDTTHITGSFKIKKIIFEDDNNKEQVIAFSQADKTKITTNESKLTNVTYDSSQNKTTISNATHLNSLTCGNFSTAHLTGTTSNVQQQINTITTQTEKVANIENDIQHISGSSNGTDILSGNTFIANATFTNSCILNDGVGLNFSSQGTQTKPFTDAHKTKLESDTLINSSNKLNASLIADGTISNIEFQSLNGITGNIEERLNYMQIMPGVANFNTTNLLGVTLTQGGWFNGSHEWTPSMGFLNKALHCINVMVECGNMTELIKLKSKVVIKLNGVMVAESYLNGITLQSQTANEPIHNFNLTYFHYPNLGLQHTVHIFTEYHIKAGASCYGKAQCQISQIHF